MTHKPAGPYELPVASTDRRVLSALRHLSAAGQGRGDDPASAAEEPGILSAAERYKLVHAVGAGLRHGDPERWEASDFARYAQLAEIVHQAQCECTVEIARALRACGQACLCLKGIHLLDRFYERHERYICNDVDILVRAEALPEVREAMASCGYSQSIVSHDGKVLVVPQEVIDRHEEPHYELFPFTKIIELDALGPYADFIAARHLGHPFLLDGGKTFLAVEVDIHHNLSHGIREDDVWCGAEPFALGAEPLAAPAPEVMVWFLAARFYHEVMVLGDRKAKLLGDLVKIIEGRGIDWDAVCAAARDYTLEPGMFYVLRFLRESTGIDIPTTVIEWLAASQSAERPYHDWGDFLPKLLGLKPVFTLPR